MFESIQNIVKIPELRKKLLVTFGFLIAYRIGRWMTIPGVDSDVIDSLVGTPGSGGLGDILDFASAITGGALRQCTLFALGIMPYISASIIFSLLVKVIPALEALSKEGEAGRRKITQYTRYATVGLCLIQSMFILAWMSQPVGDKYLAPVLNAAESSFFDRAYFWFQTVLVLTTGTVLLMWIGEQITEFGIGNGISLIIMAGIVEEFPGAMGRMAKDVSIASQIGENVPLAVLKFVMFLVLFVAVVIGVVIMQQGQRRIPIQQQKHTRGRRVYGGQRHYLPLRINAAGVMPVIFAESLIVLPAAVLSALPGTGFLSDLLQRGPGFWFMTLYLGLVFFFTYFWVSLTFNPVEMANNMKEYGSFIPGIRPGRRTAEYLERLMNRITLVGSVFLGLIALLPILVASTLGISDSISYLLGGTGILIVVGVALDIVQKIESHLLMRHYEGFMKGGRVRGRRGF